MKHSILIFFFLLVAFSINDFPQKLYPVKIDGKYGFINSSGELIVKPEYIEFHRFSEGFAVVKKAKESLNGTMTDFEHGYISTKGKYR